MSNLAELKTRLTKKLISEDMKINVIYILSGLALCFNALSCIKEPVEPTIEPYFAKMSFTAGFAESPTKTNRTDGGSVLWSSNEEINVFNGASVSGKFTSQNEEPARTVTFSGALSGSYVVKDDSYWAVYPYSSGNKCDGNGITISIPSVQTSDEGSFKDGVFPSVAHSSDNNLFFYNICGGFKISLSRGNIKEITLEGNNNEVLAGRIYLSGDIGERPSVSVKDGISKIILTPSTGKYFKEDVYYYFTSLPAELNDGFTMSFKTDDRIGILKTNNQISINHSIFCSKDKIDEYVTEWSEYSQKSVYENSGVYLGILAFNQSIKSSPITLLTTENRESFISFIDELSTANGTLLYYGADNGITALKEGEYPEDIENVALVTFTDGLDQGSLMMGTDYLSDEDYIDALRSKLTSEKVSGMPISAYSVGVMGADVNDQSKFRNNLGSLASSPDNVYELKNISELQNKFEEIANCISVTNDYSYNVALSIPGLSDGTRIRFTFDDTSSASDSQKYIEGTFNLRYHSLDEISYVGLSSSNGDTVAGSVEDNIFVRFTFNTLRDSTGGELDMNSIAEWYWSSDSWQKNSEFNGDSNEISADIKTKSAAIYLALDCSSSLSSDFKTLKSAAKRFVQDLYAVEHSPQSVRLNKQKLVMDVGDKFEFSASVFPVTAQVASYTWTSSNNSVITITNDGVVTAIAPGEATVSYTTHNKIQASCSIVVNKHADKEWGPADPDYTYTGLYLGVLVYNKDLYRYKICRLDDAAKSDILTFIDDIPVQNGTLMCHATEEALGEMSKQVFPSNLSKVTLVSFTDGLDQGSVMMNNVFSSTDTYLNFLNEKISTEAVQGIPINAYSIGIKGEDRTAHINSLGKLATSSPNVFSLDDNSRLPYTMNKIANSADVAVDVLNYNAYNLKITIPGVSNGSRIRFTFDNVADANKSNLFIEGTFNLKDRSLYDISFFGFESSMASSITGVVDGIFVTFEFTDIIKGDKTNLSLANIKEWIRSSGATWQVNSEFNTSNVSATSLTKKTVNQNSALLYLVLDYSSSISDYFSEFKTSVKNFVNSLSTKFVGSVLLPEEISLYMQGTAMESNSAYKLVAQVLPETAVIKDLHWNSSDVSVATVDQSGNVRPISPGQCLVTATANNGVSATCSVMVLPIAAVDLGLPSGLKWSPVNLGAMTPENSGDYYAWGETETKNDYSDDTYKWGTTKAITKYNIDKNVGIVDNKTVLDPEDDVAFVKLGGSWRMPTDAEWTELRTKCSWVWTTLNGVNGCKVTGPNGNSIFLPAAGYCTFDITCHMLGKIGNYWSSSLNTIYGYSAQNIYFECYNSNTYSKRGSSMRNQGQSIRPVTK